MREIVGHGEVIIEAIGGSTAYGLAREGSDVDIVGVFVAPTESILSLDPPPETLQCTDPDFTHHEVGKFVRLALKCNPTVLELLFMDRYEALTDEGQMLVDNRDAFLSQAAYDSYGAYAMSQARRLADKDDAEAWGRYGKHVRHCFRLLQQGRQLLETGTMSLVVPNPEELIALGHKPAEEVLREFERAYEEFRRVATALPEKPDRERVNEMLLAVRRRHW